MGWWGGWGGSGGSGGVKGPKNKKDVDLRMTMPQAAGKNIKKCQNSRAKLKTQGKTRLLGYPLEKSILLGYYRPL